MPDASHLNVAVFFASGTAELNRAALERFAAQLGGVPLAVVAEFQPELGEWIPFHVHRTISQNVAAIRAALHGRQISTAAMVFARGTALGNLRRCALSLSGARLFAYDEQLNVVRRSGFAAFAVRSALRELQRQFGPEGRGTKWLRRLANPRDAEIPIRARAAQLYGRVLAKYRKPASEIPVTGVLTLYEGVCVVIPSRDGLALLREMLPHLVLQVTRGEIIVVDNGSSDGTPQWLAFAYPEILVIQSKTPLSFARAVNAGVAASRYRRVVMLNNDMIVEPGFIDALEHAFERVPGLFCATAQIFFPPGIRREETGKAVWQRDDPLDFPVRCDNPLEGEDFTWVLYGSGGCSMFDTAMLRELGGVSEAYDPAYVEDMDFGYRAWKRGWPTVYCAGARVEHRHRATTSRFFTERQLALFVERNYLRFLTHAIGSPELFHSLWRDAIRRLQLRGDLDALRAVPRLGPQPPPATGVLSEAEILALGSGDVAAFPGKIPAPQGRAVVMIASPYLPYPLSHGGAVRIFNLMREAARCYDVVLIAFCDQLATPADPLPEICREVILVRRHGTHYRRNTPRPDAVEEFDSLTFRACLRQSSARWKPAIVQLEFTWMAQYAEACKPARTVLVEHDITFDLQRQLLKTNPSWEVEQQLLKWETFERDAWDQVDMVVTMSQKDRAQLPDGKGVMIPNGVDCTRFHPEPTGPETTEPKPTKLLFIGSFAHLPNVMAVNFFLSEVWPLLSDTFELHIIAGPNPERYHPQIALPRVQVEGFVADVRQAYRDAGIILAPLVASAGTNIKVLEAMAMGKPVVSTSAGVNGLPVRKGTDCVVVDEASGMAAEIDDLSRNGERRRRLAFAARAFALQLDWRKIGEIQLQLYDSLR